jgi:hypothetical protein
VRAGFIDGAVLSDPLARSLLDGSVFASLRSSASRWQSWAAGPTLRSSCSPPTAACRGTRP